MLATLQETVAATIVKLAIQAGSGYVIVSLSSPCGSTLQWGAIELT